MARRGARIDIRELERFQRRVQKFARVDLDKLCRELAKEIAARMLAKVIKRTPVDDGALQKGWTGGAANVSDKGGVVGVNGKNGFAQGLEVTKNGSNYEITVSNHIEYATYVEYGHRTRNHQNWVKGRFFMTISAKEVEGQAPQIVERKLLKALREVFE